MTGVVEGTPDASAPAANIMNSALYKLALGESVGAVPCLYKQVACAGHVHVHVHVWSGCVVVNIFDAARLHLWTVSCPPTNEIICKTATNPIPASSLFLHPSSYRCE